MTKVTKHGEIARLSENAHFFLKRSGYDAYRRCRVEHVDLDSGIISFKFLSKKYDRDILHYITVEFAEDNAFQAHGECFIKESQFSSTFEWLAQ